MIQSRELWRAKGVIVKDQGDGMAMLKEHRDKLFLARDHHDAIRLAEDVLRHGYRTYRVNRLDSIERVQEYVYVDLEESDE